MASKRNSRTKTDPKSKAILTLILIACVAALCVYTVFVGLGKQHKGSAKNIKLGLDLAGGVSVTYESVKKDPTATEMADTIYKMQMRVEGLGEEPVVYQEGSNRITVDIPGATNAEEV